ncbi:hypothetical protein RIF29_24635 [Crotalaria pallida]|uniref:Pectinesterase inhibitor domain-containing protein n=1 Tax=Crotalaria pallida TaxID=3830 RepID=A0AAN9EKW8_CROPI
MILMASTTIGLFATPIPKDGAGTLTTAFAVCRSTEQAKSCLEILKPVGERASELDYLKAAINATFWELLAVDVPKPFDVKMSLTPLQVQAYEDCSQMLGLGMEELESLRVMANSSVDLAKMKQDAVNVINSLSAVISYQQTCYDESLKTTSDQVFGNFLHKSIMRTRMTLAIVNYFFSERPIKIAMAAGQENANARRVSLESIGDNTRREPDAIVAQDGSGQFTTITGSLNVCKRKNKGLCIIHVKKGIYEEKVMVPKDVGQVLMYGDGPMNTIVSGINKRFPKIEATSFQAATFVVMAKAFICKNMAFIAPENITGAPALIVLSDQTAFFNCKMEGNEGTLFAVAQRQFYRDCEIHGNIDIIRGDSATIIQNSQIIVKARNSIETLLRDNVVSAQFRIDKNERTGFVIQNCTITAQGEKNGTLAGSTYLGNAYKSYSRTIIMESFLGDVIKPEGWSEWSENYGRETTTFLEYNNRGPGAKSDKRVSWSSHQTISQKQQMENYTAAEFIQSDQWLRNLARNVKLQGYRHSKLRNFSCTMRG